MHWEKKIAAVKILPRTNKQNAALGIESLYAELSALERCNAANITGVMTLYDFGVIGDPFLIVSEENVPGELIDCWSLGCLLYELIVGEFLFETGDNWAKFFMLLKDEKMGDLPEADKIERLESGH